MTVLAFPAPASSWLEALPLGNGRLGAMCWGGAGEARFDLNDETAWSGSPRSEAQQPTVGEAEAQRLLAEARDAVLGGRPADAGARLMAMQSDYTQAYLPLATLRVVVPDVSGDQFERGLDLRTAVHEVLSGSVRQRALVSAEYGVLLVLVEGAERPSLELESPLRTTDDAVSADGRVLTLRLPSDVAPTHEPDYPAATWSEEPGAALDAVVAVRLERIAPDGWAVWLTTETTFGGLGTTLRELPQIRAAAEARLERAMADGWESVLDEHTADWTARMERVSFSLDGADSTVVDPPARVAAASAHRDGPLVGDPGLLPVLFDYGRYLLLSSSRPSGLPATLQGIWNADMQPPWSSNYTLNINLSMAYWPAYVTALPETAEPLLSFVAALAAAGEETARRLYGARGWVAHHNSDAWLYTAPPGVRRGDPAWAFWPMAGAWLVRHFRDAVEFGALDARTAREVAWPAVRGAVLFALDWMQRLPDGTWGTVPSTSPENTYRNADGRAVAVTFSSALDLELLDDLFESAALIAAAAGVSDDEVLPAAAARRAELPAAPALAADGRILEWGDDVEEVDPQHRHLSPLYALYPGSARLTDEQLSAAADLLDRRGDDSTGWSLAWKMALWARLRRGDRVARLIPLLVRPAGEVSGPWAGGLYPNLLAAHPPFQLDGNLGFVAALAESFLQSSSGEVDLLPALPPGLPPGRLAGLIARPGIRVEVAWEGDTLREARLRALLPAAAGRVVLRYGNARVVRHVDTLTDTVVTGEDFRPQGPGSDAANLDRAGSVR